MTDINTVECPPLADPEDDMTDPTPVRSPDHPHTGRADPIISAAADAIRGMSPHDLRHLLEGGLVDIDVLGDTMTLQLDRTPVLDQQGGPLSTGAGGDPDGGTGPGPA